LYEDHLFGDLIVTTTSNNNNISNNNSSSSSSSLLQTVADFGVVKPFSLLTKTLRYEYGIAEKRLDRESIKGSTLWWNVATNNISGMVWPFLNLSSGKGRDHL
jgi:hypothetical protein